MNLRVLFAVFIFQFCLLLTVKGQENCILQIETYRGKVFDLSKNEVIAFPTLDKVEITLRNKKTTKVLRGISKNGVFTFENISAGEFSIELKEKNSDNMKYDLVINCIEKDENGKIYEDVLLWEKGKKPPSFKQNFQNGFIIGSKDESNPSKSDSTIDGRIILGKTSNLIHPAYPPAARAVRASGAVNVLVLINELGRIISAKAVSGHPLLQSATVKAARATRFSPTLLDGVPIRVSGIVVYNFTP